jgi:hypothetical protein
LREGLETSLSFSAVFIAARDDNLPPGAAPAWLCSGITCHLSVGYPADLRTFFIVTAVC